MWANLRFKCYLVTSLNYCLSIYELQSVTVQLFELINRANMTGNPDEKLYVQTT